MKVLLNRIKLKKENNLKKNQEFESRNRTFRSIPKFSTVNESWNSSINEKQNLKSVRRSANRYQPNK